MKTTTKEPKNVVVHELGKFANEARELKRMWDEDGWSDDYIGYADEAITEQQQLSRYEYQPYADITVKTINFIEGMMR